MATEVIVEDVYKKVAEIEKFIDLSADFIDSVDLQNAMYEQDGLDILDKMEKEGLSLHDGKYNLSDITGEEKIILDPEKDINDIKNKKDFY